MVMAYDEGACGGPGGERGLKSYIEYIRAFCGVDALEY